MSENFRVEFEDLTADDLKEGCIRGTIYIQSPLLSLLGKIMKRLTDGSLERFVGEEYNPEMRDKVMEFLKGTLADPPRFKVGDTPLISEPKRGMCRVEVLTVLKKESPDEEQKYGVRIFETGSRAVVLERQMYVSRG